MAAFTTVAAGIGLAATAGTTGMSFVQAGKQRKLQRQAETDAAAAMAEARKKLEVNFYDQLAIQKEPYELAREASLVQGAEALQAGVEGEQRGAGAVAGRVQMAQNQQQGDIRSAMGQELLGLEKMSAAEESRLRDAAANLDLAEAQGAQLAARDAGQAATAATTAGMAGVQSLGQQVTNLVPLYQKDQGARQYKGLAEQAKSQGLSPEQFQNRLVELSKTDTRFANLAGVGYTPTGLDAQGKALQNMMTPLAAQDYLSGLGGDYLKSLRSALFPSK
jgi:hypothetical protein